MSRLAYEDRADMLFDQIDMLLRRRIENAQRCMDSPNIVTPRDYPEKIKALQEVRGD